MLLAEKNRISEGKMPVMPQGRTEISEGEMPVMPQGRTESVRVRCLREGQNQ